ncbi:hypothetical protein KIW84_054357 [Lathyrus oleraceus]|uniref:Arabidopsis retrotransposon Orf1 C-terminal domain-containing protein n=1 Tax=Pisum sativum TaxID=3888 RepID=A0A9D4WVL3_PEA|nr:hypothetical protein KIW84_054357 [Pisum sativum]
MEALIASLERAEGENIEHAKEAEAHTCSERISPPEREVVEEVEKEALCVIPPPYKSPIPVMRRYVEVKLDPKSERYQELLENIHTNAHLFEILNKKRKLEDRETRKLISIKRGKLDFEVVDEKIEPKLEKLALRIEPKPPPQVQKDKLPRRRKRRKEDRLIDLELDYFWGNITGNNHPELDLMHSENIHNPAIRYFHKILTHTLFGKEQNITFVSKDKLLIMYCASHARPVNAVIFIIANLDRITQDNHEPILVGGLVTMIANAIGLKHPLIRLTRPMNIRFCFNIGIIRNLGSDVFEFLINRQVVHLFILPDHRTSVHDRNNWLYDLDGPPDAPPSPP